MTASEIITELLTMLAGLAIFMFGLKTMSEKLEKQAGNKLRNMFNKATSNRFIGVSVGAGVTAIIQSSSATTVMVVGFVNAGILTLTQATAIIMGANIGTTVTAVIISLPVTEVLAASAVAGVFMVMFSRKSGVKNIGYVITGLGMIFAGLLVMSSSMQGFSDYQPFIDFFTNTKAPILLVLIGALITAVIQSSSATSGILITLANVGFISTGNALFIILGINIGTCITAILASIGTNVNAQRTAAIHLLFNLIGSVFFFILLNIDPVYEFITGVLGKLNFSDEKGAGAQIAAFHIIFNVTTTALLLPFINFLVLASKYMVFHKNGKGNGLELKYLNDLILETPSIAVAQAKKEIIRMADMAKLNLDLAVDAAITTNLKHKDDFDSREDYIDWLNQEIPTYLTKISALQISYEDEFVIASYYHVISDIERIGDYAENLFDYTVRMNDENLKFSAEAKAEIKEMYDAVLRLYHEAMRGFIDQDISRLNEVERLEQIIDDYKVALSDTHIRRLNERICTAQTGALFLSLVSNLERIADHIRNIFNSIRKYTKQVKAVNTVIVKKV
jgi:phosphate:Na+ symporter